MSVQDLHNAVEKGDETAVKRLVLRKVDVNAVVDSVTPLMLAAIEGNHHIILVRCILGFSFYVPRKCALFNLNNEQHSKTSVTRWNIS